jgi:hypothetical protein
MDSKAGPDVDFLPVSSGGYSTLVKSSSSIDSGSMESDVCGNATVVVGADWRGFVLLEDLTKLLRADTVLLVGGTGSGGEEFLESEEESQEKSPDMVILRFPGLRGLGSAGSVFSESPLLPASGDECRAASFVDELSEPRASFESLDDSLDGFLVLGGSVGDGLPEMCWSTVSCSVLVERLPTAVTWGCECDWASW